MSLTTFDAFISRIAGNYYWRQPIWGQLNSTTTAAIAGATSGTMQRCGDTCAMPALPSGVTAYIPTHVMIGSSVTVQVGFLIAKVINLGTFNIGNTTVGTFTNGSAMPQQEVFNTASTYIPSAVLVEVTTATAGTQTSTTVTYTNQAGTTLQTTSFTPVTSAVAGSTAMLQLSGTDWGVRDITAVARSASSGPTGVLKFWGIIPISFTSNAISGAPIVDNMITSGINLVRLGASDEIETFAFGSTTARTNLGEIYFVADD